MKKIIDFVVLECETESNQHDQLIKQDGWQPFGGVSSSYTHGEVRLFQSFVRYGE